MKINPRMIVALCLLIGGYRLEGSGWTHFRDSVTHPVRVAEKKTEDTVVHYEQEGEKLAKSVGSLPKRADDALDAGKQAANQAEQTLKVSQGVVQHADESLGEIRKSLGSLKVPLQIMMWGIAALVCVKLVGSLISLRQKTKQRT